MILLQIVIRDKLRCFREWVESIGFKKDRAYGLIQRYDLIVGNSDNQSIIEDLPVSLTYERSWVNESFSLQKCRAIPKFSKSCFVSPWSHTSILNYLETTNINQETKSREA